MRQEGWRVAERGKAKDRPSKGAEDKNVGNRAAQGSDETGALILQKTWE